MSAVSTSPERAPGRSNGRDHDLSNSEAPREHEAAEEQALGRPGRAFTRRHPFFIGLMGALGVLTAIVLFRILANVGSVLELIGLALFLAIGLDPAVVWLTRRTRMPRWVAVVVVVLVALGFVGLFVVAAIGPISHEIHALRTSYPKWKKEAEDGKGWLGHLVKEFHLKSYLTSSKIKKVVSPSTVAGGVVGAGKIVISAVSAVVIVAALTLYFLIALPGVRTLWLRFMPRSRRTRVAALSDEVMSRVGGFVLGNLLTSVVAGIGTWVWLTIVATIIGGVLLGLLGALIAIPIAAGIHLVLEEVTFPSLERR